MKALLIALLPALAAAAPVALTPAPESVLWIEGDSTLHPYSSTTTALTLEMTLDRGENEGLATAAKRKSPAKLTLKAPVVSLVSAHKQLDKNLQKALKAGEHPDIVFILEDYGVPSQTPAVVVANGKLTIAGTTKPAAVTARVSEKDGRLLVEGEHTLLMTDFGVKPPKMMMGAIKTADKVVVKFRLLLGAGS